VVALLPCIASASSRRTPGSIPICNSQGHTPLTENDMILIVEDARPLDAAPLQRQRECPLHLVLRRMGFHAARAPTATTDAKGCHAPHAVASR
jgi:hypothetical protein